MVAGIAVHHVPSSKFSSRPLPARVARRTTLDQVTKTTRLTPGDKALLFTLPDADGNNVVAGRLPRTPRQYFYPAA